MNVKTLVGGTAEGIDLLVKSFSENHKVKFTQTSVVMSEKGLRFIYVLFWE